MKKVWRFIIDALKFIVGMADMHPIENITWDCDPIGPRPKGSGGGALIAGIVAIVFLYYFDPLASFHFGTKDPEASRIMIAILFGCLFAAIYDIPMTQINWAIWKMRHTPEEIQKRWPLREYEAYARIEAATAAKGGPHRTEKPKAR